MASRDFSYRVRVQADDVKQIADDVERAFAEGIDGAMNVGRPGRRVNTGRPGRGQFAGMGGLIAGGAAGLVAGIGAREIARIGSEMNELATASINAESALVGFAGGAGEAAERIQAIQEASRGAVSRMEAMTIANKGATLGFGETSEELSRVTDLATRIATVFGAEVTPTIDNMAAAAANLSFVRLDTLGISADRARERFEELRQEMGDTQAFMQAMLEIGEETFADVEPQVAAINELRKSWANYQEFLAREAQPAIERTTELMNEALPRMEGHARVTKLLEEATFDMSSAYRDFRGELSEIDWLFVTGQTEEAKRRFAELQAEVEAATQAANAMPSSLDAMGFSIAGVGADAETAAGQVAGLTQELQGLMLMAGMDIEGGFSNAVQMAAGAADPMFVDPGTGPTIGEVLNEQQEEMGAAILEKVNEERRLNEQNAREQERLQEQAAREAQRAWERAAAETQAAFESAVRSVPGLFGTSQVTEGQMRMAEAGVPQRFADSFLREFEDQLLNNVDRGIDVEAVARQAGIDPDLPADVMASMFRDMWESGRLFADPSNIERFIDFDAVQRSLEQQQQAAAGQENLMQAVSARFGEMFDLQNVGANLGNQVVSSITSENVAQPVAEAMAGQFDTPEINQRMGVAGDIMSDAIFTQFEDGARGKAWAATLVSIFNDAVDEYLASLAEGAAGNGGGG